MGIELVKAAAVLHAPNVSGRAFKVLIRMAITALDKPNAKGQPPNLYFDGWELLALAIGQDPERNARRAYEHVRRVLKELEGAGLIERLVEHPSKQSSRQQTYRLNLGPAPKTGSLRPQNGGTRPPDQGRSDPEKAGPRTDRGLTEDLSQDGIPSSPYATTDRATKAAAMDAHEFEDDQTQHHDCAVCTMPRRHPDHRSGAA